MDYFDILLAKKLSGGGGGDITVEGLNVEENGTYTAPSGKAYSPVVVNLPLDEKTITANGEYLASADDLKGYSKVTVNVAGFKVKDMPAGAISSFADGTDNPLKELKVSIVPVQSGSGDPSPTNPRPISGWTGANVHVADGETPHVIDNVYPISWQTEAGTVYGGELDVTSGVLTVDWAELDMGTFDWDTYSNTAFVASVTDRAYGNFNVMCEIYKTTTSTTIGNMQNLEIKGSADNDKIIVKDSAYNNDKNAFKQGMNGVQLVYELATPQTYQLTPTQVSSILGVNNIWADTGNILEGEYFVAL